MDSHKFLSAVLPDIGHYCLLLLKNKKPPIQKIYDTIDIADYAAHNFDRDGYDTYFALSSFKDASIDNPRALPNVLQTKALFLDIDCGLEKAKKGAGYATQQEGFDALKKFLKDTNLPTPTYVKSGRGWHIYWVLKEPMTYDKWFPVAEALKRLTKSEGLICDPAVTSDASRVLRVPNTNNYKDNPPKPVEVMGDEVLLYDFDELAALIGDTSIPVPALFKPSDRLKALMKGDSALTGYDENYENSFKLIMEKTVAGKGCAQLEHIITHQADIEEPLWRAGLSIASRCKNSEKIAHVMSSGHPDYDPDETLKKMDEIEGPYLCETFDSLNPDMCKDCPNLNKIKTPLVLGRQFIEAPLEAVPAVGWDAEPDSKQLETTDGRPACPFPFKWSKGAGVYMEVVDKSDGETKTILVYEHDFFVRERINDPLGDGESVVFILNLPFDGIREFTIPLAKLQNPTEMRKCLAREGIVSPHAWNHIEHYVTQSVIQLQLKRKAIPINRQFGWTEDRGGFIIGENIYRAGQNPSHNFPMKTTRHLFKHMTSKGNIADWSYMANCYKGKDLELRQMIMCMGFGSPLMDMIDNVACSAFHIYSKDSGLGKTACLDSAISIWGKPEGLRLKADDTDNGRMKRTSMYKSILACMDELTNLDGETLSATVYKLSSGQERVRLNRNSEEMAVGEPWSLISITTANTSMLERIAMAKNNPNAEAQRLMECFFDRVPRPDVDEDKFNHALVSNHGVAGPIFIQYVLDNYDEVKEALLKWRIYLRKRFKLTSENRFWSAGLACILLGGIIANRLGLIDYDMKNLTDYMGVVIKENKANIKTQSETVKETVSRYVAEHQSQIVQVNGGKSDALTGFTLEQKMHGRIIGRWEKTTGTLMLSDTPFNTWLAKQQIGVKETLKAMSEQLDYSKITQCHLTKGTSMMEVKLTCYVITGYSEED